LPVDLRSKANIKAPNIKYLLLPLALKSLILTKT